MGRLYAYRLAPDGTGAPEIAAFANSIDRNTGQRFRWRKCTLATLRKLGYQPGQVLEIQPRVNLYSSQVHICEAVIIGPRTMEWHAYSPITKRVAVFKSAGDMRLWLRRGAREWGYEATTLQELRAQGIRLYGGLRAYAKYGDITATILRTRSK